MKVMEEWDTVKSEWIKAGEENRNPIDDRQPGQWGSLLTMEQLSFNAALLNRMVLKRLFILA